MKRVPLGRHTLEVPLLQGGMGVGISLGGLAGAVAACGAMGVISAAHPGYREPDFAENYRAANCRALQKEIRRARELSQGRGMIGVNIMTAMNHYGELVEAAIQGGADAIISGAGLPLELPGLVGESDILLAPIVSSGKAARLICQSWQRHHGRLPDFVVVEGCEAGGHLGFKPQELESGTALPLEQIVPQVVQALQAFATPEHPIPVFAGGGIFTREDARRVMDAGADGVQVATRLVATPECDAAEAYKQTYLLAQPQDIVLVKSPVGMPGRALHSPLVERQEKEEIRHCMGCLRACDQKNAPYCIAQALIRAAQGDWENGLFFCGSNAWRLERMEPVQQVIQQIMGEG